MVAIPPVPVPVPVPVPLAFQAFQLPKTNKADFNHVLEHVTILGTPSQRLRIRATSGAMTDNNLLYIDKELLLKTVTATTAVMSKIKLKALKRWTKEQETLGNKIDIHKFTLNVYRKIQQELSKSGGKKGNEERQSSNARLSKFD